MKYDLRYETREGRCCWCWETLPAESHTVVASLRPPHVEMRFHHDCWSSYRALSGIESGAVGVGGEWPPQRVEALRIHAGMTVRDFSTSVGVTESTYHLILGGDERALGPGVRARVKKLATRTHFERTDHVDWTQGEAVFCFRMERGWTIGEMARETGCNAQSVQLWQWQGVPERSVRSHGRLTELARQHGFDQGMVVAHRLWTREHLVELYKANKDRFPASYWAQQAGVPAGTFHQWLRGTRKIVPESAWHLTRAAARLGLSLPPEGLVELRKGAWSEKRKPLPPEAEQRRLESLKESKWTLQAIALLGTLPDRVLAKQLGRSRNSVAIMRRALGIEGMDVRTWDGQPRAQTVSNEELQARWDRVRGELRQRASERRQRGLT